LKCLFRLFTKVSSPLYHLLLQQHLKKQYSWKDYIVRGRLHVKQIFLLVLSASFISCAAQGQDALTPIDITHQQTYAMHRSTSREATGGNADYRTVTPGETLTVLDVDGPGRISHIWLTVNSPESYHLKRVVLRMYWDGESTPSVETPVGDFFGLGTGEYNAWSSVLLSAGADHALNSYFQMPYAKHARITLTNEGKQAVSNLYWNIDYRQEVKPLTPGTLYFHAQYRQAQPNHGWTSDWYRNSDPRIDYRRNLDGRDNYVWFEAKGHGQFIGVTLSILQNQDGWWGEGNERFEVDDGEVPTIVGTGSEDYFLGAWGFIGAQSFPLHGAPVVGHEFAGSRSSVYRFHLDSPMPFTKSMKASIEHGHANARSDNYYSVAYWYQSEPHMPFPPLPEMSDRIPTLQSVGGPGNAGASAVNSDRQPR
jgi:hypothetical protein